MPSVLSWRPYFEHLFERGTSLKKIVDAKRLVLDTCPKYGGAWPFHSGFVMVAWWRPLGRLLGPLEFNLDQNSKFKLVVASGRAPGASGTLSEPRVVPDACPPCGHLVPTWCPPCGQLVRTSCPTRVHLVPNLCPTRDQTSGHLVPDSCSI